MNKDLSPDLNNGITRAIFISWGTTPELKGHSQLWDRADLDNTFVSLKRVYLNPKSNERDDYI